MKVLERIESEVGNVVKYVFEYNSHAFEVSYINKDKRTDDEAVSKSKHIICVSTHSGCVMGCKFCHLTNCSSGMVQLAPSAIMDAIDIIYLEQICDKDDREILISFMGSGEPTMASLAITHIMNIVPNQMKDEKIRFALATMLPDNRDSRLSLFDLADTVKKKGHNLKVHLSLHFTNNTVRKEWMPSSSEIEPSIAALDYYHKLTGCEVEIHYALIKGINDNDSDLQRLITLLKYRNIPIKFLKFNPVDGTTFEPSEKSRFSEFRMFLANEGILSEYYEPDGADVGASCGQFKLEHYK